MLTCAQEKQRAEHCQSNGNKHAFICSEVSNLVTWLTLYELRLRLVSMAAAEHPHNRVTQALKAPKAPGAAVTPTGILIH